MGDLAFSRERHRLYGDEEAQFQSRALGLALALIGPEEDRRGNVDPFEPALDRFEMRSDEIPHLGAELIDKESAPRTDHLGCGFCNVVADAGWKGRQG